MRYHDDPILQMGKLRLEQGKPPCPEGQGSRLQVPVRSPAHFWGCGLGDRILEVKVMNTGPNWKIGEGIR